MNWEERPEIPRNSLVERSLTISLFSIIDINRACKCSEFLVNCFPISTNQLAVLLT